MRKGQNVLHVDFRPYKVNGLVKGWSEGGKVIRVDEIYPN